MRMQSVVPLRDPITTDPKSTVFKHTIQIPLAILFTLKHEF